MNGLVKVHLGSFVHLHALFYAGTLGDTMVQLFTGKELERFGWTMFNVADRKQILLCVHTDLGAHLEVVFTQKTSLYPAMSLLLLRVSVRKLRVDR